MSGIVHERDSAFHRIHVEDVGAVRVMRFERNRQSSMMLDDPFDTDFEYPGYLHLTMAVAPHAERTLVIGLGGGSVVKRMWRDYAPMRLDVVEIDPDVVDVARVYFALPEDARISVHVGDGRAFLETGTCTYDIVIVDAFDDDHIPRPLLTEEAMRRIHARLDRDGVAAWNFIGTIHGPHNRLLRSFYRTAGNVWRNVWLFPIGLSETMVENVHNIVILASDIDLTDEELLERIGTRAGGRVTVPGFEAMAADLYTGRLRTTDAPLLLDPAAGRPRRRR